MILSAPKDISGNDIDIPALSKINLVFSLTNHVAYDMTSRLIRYQTRVIKEIITSHSTNISILHRRNFSRLSFNTKCIFSAVQVITDDAKKDNVIEYKPLESEETKSSLLSTEDKILYICFVRLFRDRWEARK